MLERTIERKVCAEAKRRGWLVRKVACPSHRGFPDRFFVKNGSVLLVEFKAPGNKPRKNQLHEHKQLRAAGLRVAVIDSVDVGLLLLESLG